MPSLTRPLLARRSRGTLNDYVTAIAWSPATSTVAIASAVGEILLVHPDPQTERILQAENGQSTDCLAFSANGRYLAAGGQSGQLSIWSLHSPDHPPLVFPHDRTWLDHLAWHPTRDELAFSLGRDVQVWDAEAADIIATLPFENSSVLDLAWHPQGSHLIVGGHQGLKVWSSDDWAADPVVREIPTASVKTALSSDGQYLASGNLDQTLLIWPFGDEFPWQMRGFPGKVRQLAWSDVTVGQAPLLATASSADVIIWHKQSDESDGWGANVLDVHDGRVNAIAFQPNSTLLASAAEDGQLCLWEKAQQVAQILEGAANGFSTLAWSPDGKWLAAGGHQGEWLLWQENSQGKGFG